MNDLDPTESSQDYKTHFLECEEAGIGIELSEKSREKKQNNLLIMNEKLEEARLDLLELLTEDENGRSSATSYYNRAKGLLGHSLAKICHGLSGPLVRSETWETYPLWGKYKSVPFYTLRDVAARVIVARARATKPPDDLSESIGFDMKTTLSSSQRDDFVQKEELPQQHRNHQSQSRGLIYVSSEGEEAEEVEVDAEAQARRWREGDEDEHHSFQREDWEVAQAEDTPVEEEDEEEDEEEAFEEHTVFEDVNEHDHEESDLDQDSNSNITSSYQHDSDSYHNDMNDDLDDINNTSMIDESNLKHINNLSQSIPNHDFIIMESDVEED